MHNLLQIMIDSSNQTVVGPGLPVYGLWLATPLLVHINLFLSQSIVQSSPAFTAYWQCEANNENAMYYLKATQAIY